MPIADGRVIVIEKGVYDRVGMLTFEQGADSASCSVRVVSDSEL